MKYQRKFGWQLTAIGLTLLAGSCGETEANVAHDQPDGGMVGEGAAPAQGGESNAGGAGGASELTCSRMFAAGEGCAARAGSAGEGGATSSDGAYTLVKLGDAFSASRINERGQVAGSIYCASRSRAALADASGVLDLGVLPGDAESRSIDINGKGEVVGSSTHFLDPGAAGAARGAVHRPFLWKDGAMTPLGGVEEGEAIAVNDDGTILIGRREESSSRAFIWEAGVLTELSPPDGGSAFPLDLNAAGQVLIRTATGRSLVWAQGTWQALPFFAAAINDLGQVVGTLADDSNTLVLWQDGLLSELLTFDASLDVYGLNNHGVVVGGQVNNFGTTTSPFAFSVETGLRLLPGVEGRLLGTAVGLNDRGDIIGDSVEYRSPGGSAEVIEVAASDAIIWSQGCWSACCP